LSHDDEQATFAVAVRHSAEGPIIHTIKKLLKLATAASRPLLLNLGHTYLVIRRVAFARLWVYKHPHLDGARGTMP